jgi:hypothetical protein
VQGVIIHWFGQELLSCRQRSESMGCRDLTHLGHHLGHLIHRRSWVGDMTTIQSLSPPPPPPPPIIPTTHRLPGPTTHHHYPHRYPQPARIVQRKWPCSDCSIIDGDLCAGVGTRTRTGWRCSHFYVDSSSPPLSSSTLQYHSSRGPSSNLRRRIRTLRWVAHSFLNVDLQYCPNNITLVHVHGLDLCVGTC